MQAGRLIAEIVPDLPAETRSELLRLLDYFEAAPSEPRWRYGRLGLLSRLLDAADGDVISVRAYDAARAGEPDAWPSASQLSRSYGGWMRATDAAAWLARERRIGQAPRRAAAQGIYRMFSRAECVTALEQCCQVLGDWPTRYDYHHWYRVTREVRRRFSGADARIPNSTVIERQFGTWHDALTYVRTARS